MNKLLRLLPIVAGIAACSHSGGAPPMPVQSQAAKATATFVMHWPAAPSGNSRRPDFVSPSSRSVTIAVNNGALKVVNAPNPSSSPKTTNIAIDAPPGTDSFQIKLFDQFNGNGNVLGQALVSQQILAGRPNTINATVDGVCRQIAISPASAQPYVESSSFAAGPGYTLVGPVAETFNVAPLDADGNVILAPGDVPAISLAAPRGIALTQTGQYQFSLQPNSIQNGGLIAPLVASSPQCAPGGAALVTTSAIVLVFTASPNLSTGVFDQNGNQIPIPAGRFAGLTTPSGIAYAPLNGGTLYVTDETQNSISMYDLFGNSISSYGGFPNTSQPLGIVSDMHDLELYVTNFNYGASYITAYDRIGDQLNPSGGFHLTTSANALTTFPQSNNLYVVTGLGVAQYDENGNYFGMPGFPGAAGANGITTDTANTLLYVAAGPNALAYDRNGNQVFPPGGFPNVQNASAVAYNPSNDLLYVLNSPSAQPSNVELYDGNGDLISGAVFPVFGYNSGPLNAVIGIVP